jgi:hypothetical protein
LVLIYTCCPGVLYGFFKCNVCSNLLSDREFRENRHSKSLTLRGSVNPFVVILSVLSGLSDIPCKRSEQNVGAFLSFVKIGHVLFTGVTEITLTHVP